MKNINTPAYWDSRFSTGDWENKEGRKQTIAFAKEQVGRLGLPTSFVGTILDFGCGLGDAMEIYKKTFPNAELIGVDHSKEGIAKCEQKYSNIAKFIHGSIEAVPTVDVIISSNVFEHLSNDQDRAKMLAARCSKLFIIVPYRDFLDPVETNEHINTYDENSFPSLVCLRKEVFESDGNGRKSRWWVLFHVWIKNIVRFIIRRKTVRYTPPKEIIFEFQGGMIKK